MKKIFHFFIPLLLFVGCKNNYNAESKNLTVVSYGGGSYHKSHINAFINPYIKVTGQDVDALVWNAEYGKLKAMVESGRVPWDVVEVTDAQFKRGIKEELFEQLKLFPDTTGFIKGTINNYGVANVYWTTVLAYNKNSFLKNKPSTWKDFWNIKKFPGKRALYDDPRGNLEFALLADGVSKDSLYPIDVERAFKKLDEIKPYIHIWWKDGTQPVQLLKDNSVDLTSAWNGRIFSLDEVNSNIEFSWFGAISELDWWVIPKGSKNVEKASRFITFISEPDKMANQAQIIGYGPVNTIAFKYIPENIQKSLPTYKKNWDVSLVINSNWWAENENVMMKRWIKWKSK